MASSELKPTVASRAFTLIEMLVAMAVLSLLVVLIAQIIGMTSSTVSNSSQKLDAVAESRFTLDRLGIDLASRVNRPDVAQKFDKKSGNDELTFYSEVDGYQGERRVSLVGYRVQESDGRRLFQLERGAQGTGTSHPPIRFGPQTLPTIDDADYEVLSEGVLRLEFTFLKKDGKLSNTANADLSDVRAVVVAIAVLDSSTRKIVNEGPIRLIAENLPNSVEGQDPLTGWHEMIEKSKMPSGIPLKAIQGIRFYQRYYEIN